MAGSYDISCPDPECPAQVRNFVFKYYSLNCFIIMLQGVLSHPQKESLTDKELLDKHKSFRLNTGNILIY